MKAVVAAFNQEKALVGAFSVITNLRMELFEALVTRTHCSDNNTRTLTLASFQKLHSVSSWVTRAGVRRRKVMMTERAPKWPGARVAVIRNSEFSCFYPTWAGLGAAFRHVAAPDHSSHQHCHLHAVPSNVIKYIFVRIQIFLYVSKRLYPSM